MLLMHLGDTISIIITLCIALSTVLLSLYTMSRAERREDATSSKEESRSFAIDIARMESKLDSSLEKLNEIANSQKEHDIKLTEYGLELRTLKEHVSALDTKIDGVAKQIRNDDLDNLEKRVTAISHEINGIPEDEMNESKKKI